MSVRVRYTVQATVSSSSAEEKNLGNEKFEVVTDASPKGGSWKTLVPAGATNLQLELGNIASVAFLVIRVEAADPNDDPVEISVKRNSSGGEAWPITPLEGASEGVMLLSTSGLTELYASNAEAVDAAVTVIVAGT